MKECNLCFRLPMVDIKSMHDIDDNQVYDGPQYRLSCDCITFNLFYSKAKALKIWDIWTQKKLTLWQHLLSFFNRV